MRHSIRKTNGNKWSGHVTAGCRGASAPVAQQLPAFVAICHSRQGVKYITLSYLPAYAYFPSDNFIWLSIQVRLGHMYVLPQNTTYCSVAQSKEIKVFICNFLSHLSVNVSSYKHFMAIFVQRLLLIISAFNKEKSLQVSWRYLTFVSVNRYKGRT